MIILSLIWGVVYNESQNKLISEVKVYLEGRSSSAQYFIHLTASGKLIASKIESSSSFSVKLYSTSWTDKNNISAMLKWAEESEDEKVSVMLSKEEISELARLQRKLEGIEGWPIPSDGWRVYIEIFGDYSFFIHGMQDDLNLVELIQSMIELSPVPIVTEYGDKAEPFPPEMRGDRLNY